MVKVDGKETLYSTSFLLEHTSTAVAEIPQFPKTKFYFEVTSEVESEQAEREPEFNFRGDDVIMRLPYLRKVEACTDPFTSIGNLLGSNVSACITRQSTKGRMLVHFEIYVDGEAGYPMEGLSKI